MRLKFNDNTPVGNVFKHIPTGNKSLDRKLIAIFNKYDDSNNLSIVVELCILNALYPNEMTPIISDIHN